jgi:hypothetical protein
MDGLHSTVDWYFSIKDRAKVAAQLDRLLTERVAELPRANSVVTAD